MRILGIHDGHSLTLLQRRTRVMIITPFSHPPKTTNHYYTSWNSHSYWLLLSVYQKKNWERSLSLLGNRNGWN
jgi:hypothetical protein